MRLDDRDGDGGGGGGGGGGGVWRREKMRYEGGRGTNPCGIPIA